MTASKDQSAPLVVICGSTGTQGGSVILELIKSDRPYRIRGLTRDPTKPAGQKLEAQGVDVIKVDLNAGNSAGIAAAFSGADIIFGVTNFWEHFSVEKEIGDGKAIVDAAKRVGAKLLVWSGLPDVNAISGGRYTTVAHFDGKAAVTRYSHEIGVPTVEVQAGFYASNLPTQMIKKGPDGSLILGLPTRADTLFTVTDIVKDYGLFVRQAIETEGSAGTVVRAFGQLISPKDMCREFEEVTGKKLTKLNVSYPEFTATAEKGGAPPHIAKEVTEMFQFIEDFGYYGPAGDLEAEKKALNLPRPTTTFKEFVKSQDWSTLL